MKDKRIWIVIICILVIGTGVTHYTKYYVKRPGNSHGYGDNGWRDACRRTFHCICL